MHAWHPALRALFATGPPVYGERPLWGDSLPLSTTSPSLVLRTRWPSPLPALRSCYLTSASVSLWTSPPSSGLPNFPPLPPFPTLPPPTTSPSRSMCYLFWAPRLAVTLRASGSSCFARSKTMRTSSKLSAFPPYLRSMRYCCSGSLPSLASTSSVALFRPPSPCLPARCLTVLSFAPPLGSCTSPLPPHLKWHLLLCTCP